MDVIDEDGRLFGYVNVVDAAVVALVFALLVAGVLVVVTDGTGPAREPGPEPEPRYAEITVRDVPASVGRLVDTGDGTTLIADDGSRVNGAPKARSELFDTFVTRTGPDTVTLRLFARVPAGSVRAGESVTVNTTGYRLKGTVTDLRSSRSAVGIDRTRVTAELRTAGLAPSVADDIEPDMTVRRNGDVVARVADVRVEPAAVAVRSDDGGIFRRDHPIKKNVTLTVALTARETGTGLWFNDRRVGVGSGMALYFNGTTVDGTVTGVRREGDTG